MSSESERRAFEQGRREARANPLGADFERGLSDIFLVSSEENEARKRGIEEGLREGPVDDDDSNDYVVVAPRRSEVRYQPPADADPPEEQPTGSGITLGKVLGVGALILGVALVIAALSKKDK